MGEMKSLTLNDKRYDGFVDPVARELAAATAVIKSASGESVTLPDSGGNKLYGLNIYGRTTQDGTPSPSSPVELESVGDKGSVTVIISGERNSQNLVIETPNGLSGFPVATGGNYTDANGQQWVCDEVDFNTGMLIRRCGHYVFNGSEQWAGIAVSTVSGTPYVTTPVARSEREYDDNILCNLGDGRLWNGPQYTLFINGYGRFAVGGEALRGATTVDEFKEILAKNPIELVYKLETPIETPLSEDEIAAYNALRTYRGTTTVSNDAGAYMELEYAMDAKTYIDSLFAKSVARLTNVTLPASAWEGSGSLYSQMVTIDGITEYSKVDLLPSVEQLAIFHNKDVAFVTENEDGVVTVYAIGEKPTNDYVIQASVTEVAV